MANKDDKRYYNTLLQGKTGNKRYHTTFVVCSDVTWVNFYADKGWKFNRLEDILQLRGWECPHVIFMDGEDSITALEYYDLQVVVEALAELGHIHLEYGHIEDCIVGEGEEVVISKFFPTEL